MSKPIAYDETLEDILKFSGGKRVLSIGDVRRYTGLSDNRLVYKRYPAFSGKMIEAPKLARLMCGGGATR